MATSDSKSTNSPAQTQTDTQTLAETGASDPDSGTTASTATTSGKQGERANEGVNDPTDGSDPKVGDAAVTIEGDGSNVDRSDPQQNANVGFSAEGQVVSNQMGEQVNTVQASEEDRSEVEKIRAEDAKVADPWSDPNVTNPA